MDEKIEKERQIKSKIIKARKNIRAKYLSLKRGEQRLEQNLQTLYKPIIQPLNVLTEKITNTPRIKDEVKNEVFNIKNEKEDDSSSSSSLEEKYGSKVDKYMQKYINSKDKKYIYGVSREKDGEWKIGNTSVDFQNKNMMLNGKTYQLTEGLCELLFKKTPQNYDEEDLQTYKNILVLTNVHRKKFKSSGQITGARSQKYRNIISKLIYEGEGIAYRSVNKPNIIYYDDVNELIQRLMLLNAEKLAGNLAVENEIISILEELRELGIIA